MFRSLLVAAGIAAAVVGAALPANAATRHSVPVSSVTITFSNHGDGGGAGNMWAEDQGQADETVTQTGPNQYTAHIVIEGSFKTNAGQLAPNQGPGHAGQVVTSNQKVGASSTIAGTADYVFTADQPPSGVLGIVPITGDFPRLGDWYKLAFPAGTNFTGGLTAYNLDYRQGCPLSVTVQHWNENIVGDGQLITSGQIRGC